MAALKPQTDNLHPTVDGHVRRGLREEVCGGRAYWGSVFLSFGVTHEERSTKTQKNYDVALGGR
jgi:hypothetical protein